VLGEYFLWLITAGSGSQIFQNQRTMGWGISFLKIKIQKIEIIRLDFFYYEKKGYFKPLMFRKFKNHLKNNLMLYYELKLYWIKVCWLYERP
jgi:hypothetical protein